MRRGRSLERQRRCSGGWARRSSGRVAEELAEEAATVEVGARVAAAGKEAGKAGLVGEEGRG